MKVASRSRVVIIAVAGVLLAGLVVAPGAIAPRPDSRHVAAAAHLLRMISDGLLNPGRPVPGAHNSRSGTGLEQVSYDNWSGYADDDSGGNTYTTVSANWAQPAVTCPSDENRVAVFWVGLDGFDNSTVEQDGTLAECYEGTPYYFTWWEMYPTNEIRVVGSSVAAGDQIAASVRFTNGKYMLRVTDSTNTANSFVKSPVCGSGSVCENSSAEWIAETPSYSRGLAPFPNFGTWKVTRAQVTGSGTAGVISSFPDDQITIKGSFGERLARTDGLIRAGNGFSVAWAYAW